MRQTTASRTRQQSLRAGGARGWLLGTFCASLVFVLALPSIGEAKGPDTPITARQAAAAGPGHPWQAALPGVNGLDLHKHTRVPLFTWPTQGGNVESFSLFHNSITLATNDALAPKWTHSGDICVVTWRERRRAAVHFGSGRIQRFALQGGTYVSLDGYRDRLFRERGQFQLELTDGTLLAFRNVSPEKSVVTRVSDPDGNTTTYRYDRRGRLSRIVDPVGRELVLSYSARTRRADDEAHLAQVTFQFDGARRVADLRYGSTGLRSVQLPVFTTPADLAPERTTFGFRYDARGNIRRATDSFDNATIFRYRRSGRLTQATTPLGNIIRYALAGNLRMVTDAAGVATTFEHDALGRLGRIQNANGAEWFRRYTDPQYGFAPSEIEAPLAIIERFTYDTNGNATSFTDSRANTWNYTYDTARNLLTRAEAPLVTGNSERGRTDFEYDANRNLTAVARSLGGGNSLRDRFAYDAFGNLLSRTNGAGNAWTNQYDARGNLVEARDPVGRTYRYAYTTAESTLLFTRPDQVTTGTGDLIRVDYDQRGRVRGKSFPDATAFSYERDVMGRLARMSDPTGLTTWSYDADGRLSGEAKDSVPPLIDHALGFGYTPNNLLASIEIVGTGRDIRYTYDSVNRLTNIADNPEVAFVYNAANLLTDITRSNGASTDYGYFPGSNFRNSIIHSVGTQPPFLSFNISDNQDGTIRQVAEVDGGTTSTTSYGYDLPIRLTSEERTGANAYSLRWIFNPATGDRTIETRDGVQKTFSFDASGRPTAASSPTQTEMFTWNGGNALERRTIGSNSITYNYNPENIVREIVAGPNAAQYMSDGLDRRAFAKLSGSGTPTEETQAVYSGRTPLQRLRTVSGTTTIANNTIGPNGAVYVTSGSEQYAHGNQWGVYPAATNETGGVNPERLLLDGYRNRLFPSLSFTVVGAQITAYAKGGDDDHQEDGAGSVRRLASIDQFTAENRTSILPGRSLDFSNLFADPFAGVFSQTDSQSFLPQPPVGAPGITPAAGNLASNPTAASSRRIPPLELSNSYSFYTLYSEVLFPGMGGLAALGASIGDEEEREERRAELEAAYERDRQERRQNRAPPSAPAIDPDTIEDPFEVKEAIL